MTRIAWAAILLVGGMAAGYAAPPPAPTVRLGQDAVATASMSRKIFEAPEVRKHLMSGLTTNFIVEIPGREEHGRVAMRWEPWDEVFYLHAAGPDGWSEKQILADLEELASWWTKTRLPIATAVHDGPITVRLSVLPFSASEEADAKRWLAQSLGSRDAAADDAASASGTPSLFSAVIGSSIRRKPVLRYEWRVELKRERR